MILLELHPEVASRPCEMCQRWQYDEETGEIEKWGPNKDIPLERTLPQLTPCRTSTGCPKGTPEDSKALSRRNEQAWWFDQECKAVGEWPKDALVRRNAAIIMRAEQTVAESRQRESTEYIKLLARMSVR